MSLILTWACLLSTIILFYILLDGFDLGIGILFQVVPDKHCRDVMVSTIAPVWDGNETWLVFGAAALYGAFPVAYGVLIPALYMPIMIMVIALVFRGVAFEFRFKDENHQRIWDVAFSLGSTVAALMQGIILGRFIQGYSYDVLQTPHSCPWITSFSLLTGVTVVIGYALLGATWLIMRTEGNLQAKCFEVAEPLFIGLSLSLALVSMATFFINSHIALRWLKYSHILWIVPVLTAALAVYGFFSLRQRLEVVPFFSSVGLFVCSYVGFGISLWPYVIPHILTIWEAAAPASSLKFSLIGTGIILPVLLGYTAYTYYVFSGKVTQLLYH